MTELTTGQQWAILVGLWALGVWGLLRLVVWDYCRTHGLTKAQYRDGQR